MKPRIRPRSPASMGSNQAAPANSAGSFDSVVLSSSMAWSPPALERRSWLVEQAGDYAAPISHHIRDGTLRALHQLHPGRSRGLVRHNDCLHRPLHVCGMSSSSNSFADRRKYGVELDGPMTCGYRIDAIGAARENHELNEIRFLLA